MQLDVMIMGAASSVGVGPLATSRPRIRPIPAMWHLSGGCAWPTATSDSQIGQNLPDHPSHSVRLEFEHPADQTGEVASTGCSLCLGPQLQLSPLPPQPRRWPGLSAASPARTARPLKKRKHRYLFDAFKAPQSCRIRGWLTFVVQHNTI